MHYDFSFICRNSKADRYGLSPIELSIIIGGGNFIGGWQGDGISEYLTEGVWIAYVKDNEITDIRTYFVF